MQYITILYFLVMFISIPTLGQDQSYSIMGVLKGLGNQKVYLGNKTSGYSNASKIKLIDSCYSQTDTFYFKGRISEADFYSIEVPSITDSWATFILENSKFTIVGDIDSLSKASITGGPQQTAYINYTSLINTPFYEKYFFYNEKSANDKSNIYKDSLDILLKKFNKDFLSFVRSNPDMFIGLNELYSYAGMKMLSHSTQIASFKSLGPALQKRGINHGINIRFNGGLKKGDYLPDFTINDNNGKKITLSNNYRKYILVDFWASWCGPCIEELNKVAKWYNRKNSKIFEIISISIDVNRKNWVSAIDTHQYPWIHVSDLMGSSSNFFNQCGIRSIPQNFLIDQNGRIIRVNIKSEELLVFLKEQRVY